VRRLLGHRIDFAQGRLGAGSSKIESVETPSAPRGLADRGVVAAPMEE